MSNDSPTPAQPASAFAQALSIFMAQQQEGIILEHSLRPGLRRDDTQLAAVIKEDPLVRKFLQLAKRPAFLHPKLVYGPFYVTLGSQGQEDARFRVYRTYDPNNTALVLGVNETRWPNGVPPLYAISTTDTRASAAEWDAFADRIRGQRPSLVDRVKDGLAKVFCHA